MNIKFADGTLSYAQKYVKKPVASWKDSDDVVSLRFKGDMLELSDVTKGKTIRQYERVGAPPAVVKAEPPKKGEPKMEPPAAPADDLGFAGVWQGQYPGTSLTLIVKFTKKDTTYEVEGTVIDEAKKYRGRFTAPEAKFIKTKEPFVALNGNWEPGPKASPIQPHFKAIAHGGTLELASDKKRSTFERGSPELLANLPAPPAVAPDKTDSSGGKTRTVTPFTLPSKVAPVPPATSVELPGVCQRTSLNADGSRLTATTSGATSGAPAQVLVVDLAAQKVLWSSAQKNATALASTCLGISADGKLVACDDGALAASAVLLLDGATGKPLAPLKMPPQLLTFHPSRPLLATGAIVPGSTSLLLVDVATGKPLWREDKVHNSMKRPLFSPSGNYVATIGRDVKRSDYYLVRLFDTAKGTPLRDFLAEKSEIACAAFSPDDRYLAVYRADFGKGRVQVHDVQSGDKVQEISDLPGGFSLNQALAFVPGSKTLAIATADKHIRLVDFLTGQTTGVITQAFQMTVGDIYATADGKQLVVNAGSKTGAAADSKKLIAFTPSQIRTYRLSDALPYPPPVVEKDNSNIPK
jgi:hypothetical protein